MSALLKLHTMAALGPANVARVALYRARLRAGLHPAQRVKGEVVRGPFFGAVERRPDLPPVNRSWDGRLRWFDWFELPNPDDDPPDWFHNPFAPEAGNAADRDWWRIPDFAAGDIKGVWELSRFGWLPPFATQVAQGDAAALARIEAWLDSWSEANPPYRGPNWKCGQEASFRVLHLLIAALIFDQGAKPAPALVRLTALHLQRIAPTLSYAIGQQNNHGTSEAAALFVGGSFLAAAGEPRGSGWARAGRRQLEERAVALIAPDGGFSQYSLVYHRLMLDTYSLAEAWRRRFGLPAFSAACRERLRAATDWLAAMSDAKSGDGPNLGANDGARIMTLTDSGYRDFRPSLQLASALFRDARAFAKSGPWDDPLRWLGLAVPEAVAPPPESRTFDDSGYHVLRAGAAVALLRYPRFRFRPSQADALHLDLWAEGRNLLRDAGSFSYNDLASDWFGSVAAHNSVQFDGRDQMPRLGRFLFGGWLHARNVVPVQADGDGVAAAAGYTDAKGARHQRDVRLDAEGFRCIDRLEGRFDSAVLRWRLEPGDYRLEGATLSGERLSLSIAVEGTRPSLALTSAPESLCYLQQRDIPVLEIRVDRSCRIVTEGQF